MQVQELFIHLYINEQVIHVSFVLFSRKQNSEPTIWCDLFLGMIHEKQFSSINKGKSCKFNSCIEHSILEPVMR